MVPGEHIGKKFSVVQQCPKCSQLSLSFRHGMITCSNCGYEEKIPSLG